MAEPRRPGQVADPDAPGPRLSVADGIDTDADGRPDTIVSDDGVDLILRTDLDGDSYADRVLRIGPDGVAREVGHRTRSPWDDEPEGG
jgi:hypothetical protein